MNVDSFRQTLTSDKEDRALVQPPRILEARASIHLTPRESEIARYVLLGESNKQIARRLGISNYTVRDHVSNLLKKSGVTSRTRLGLVLPAPPVQPSPPATTFQLPGLASR